MKKYLWNIWVSADQFMNTVLGGDPDETISSRMGKKVAQSKCVLCKLVCRLLDRIQINHCIKSIEQDEGGNAA